MPEPVSSRPEQPPTVDESLHSESPPSTIAHVPLAEHHGQKIAASTVAGPLPGPPSPEIPGYEVLGVLGRGGMGVVYKARQRSLNRLVALKMIRTGGDAAAHELARFRTEAEAVALLQHPNIVQIHEVGAHADQPFFCLEFVDGGSLAQRLGGQPQPPRTAAHLAETLAQAVESAHQSGILHRDLKPANVLLAGASETPLEQCTPKITDFGLAKKIEGDNVQTQSGAILGTPSYMAPEQAAGKIHELGPACDVYALGSILYELLTGRPPFRAASLLETLEQVRTQEPVAVRRLQPKCPRDLETICLKCLRKNPDKRYASARELAGDLRRFLDGEPIQARPVGAGERTLKWARRRPAAAALVSLSVLAALAFVAIGLAYSASREAHNASLQKALKETEEQRDNATQAQRSEEAARKATETTLVDMYTSSGLVSSERHDPGQAILWFANAARQAQQDTDRQRLNLTRAATWCRQLSFVPIRALPHAGSVFRSCTFHSGGRHFLTVSNTDECTLWDVEREEVLPLPGGSRPVRSAAWSPDGKWLALGTREAGVEVFAFPEGERLQKVPHGEAIEVLSFSPDGRYLALAGTRAAVWDCRARNFVLSELRHPGLVQSLAFNTTGNRLATGCADGLARVFAVPGEEGKTRLLFPPVPHQLLSRWEDYRSARPSAPVFLDRDRTLVTVANESQGSRIDFRDAATGQPRRASAQVIDMSYSLAPSPDGRHLALSGFQGVYLWDAATGQQVGEVIRHGYEVNAVAFHPDGGSLVTGGLDGRARLWTVPDAKNREQTLRHQGGVYLTRFSADGRLLATLQEDGLVRIWAAADQAGDYRLPLSGVCSFAQLSRDGRAVLPAGMSYQYCRLQNTRVYDLPSGRPIGPVFRPEGIITDAALAPDGKRLVLLSAPHRLRPRGEDLLSRLFKPLGYATFWDYRTGERCFAPLALPQEPRCLSYSPDGDLVAVICAKGEVVVIDATTGRVRRRLQSGPVIGREPHNWINNGKVCFSPDGRSLLTWGTDSATVRVWETATGELRYCLPAKTFLQNDVQFSPDGRLLATSAPDHTVRIYEVATGRPGGGPLPHPDGVFAAHFSPDGQGLLTACADGTARLWDWRAGRLVCPPFKHALHVIDAAFTPDGHWIVTASIDSTARVWESHTGKAVTPPLPLPARAMNLCVSPDGRRVAVGNLSQSLPVFDLGDLYDKAKLDLADTCTWSELLSGQSLLPGGDLTNLSSEEWLRRWHAFRRRHPDHGRLDTAALRARHEREADNCMTDRRWFAAAFHLTRLLDAQPARAAHHARRGRAYAELGQHDQAVADLCRAVELGERDENIRFWRGRSYLYRRELEKAIEDITAALRQEEQTADNPIPRDYAYYIRGRARAERKEFSKARDDYTEALRLNPLYAGIYLDRAVVLFELGQWHQAIADCSRAIAMKHDVVRALDGRSFAYLNLHRWDEVVADCSQVIALGGGVLHVWLNRGQAFAELSRWDRAAADYAKAVEMSGADAAAWYRHALLRLQVGDADGYRKACAVLVERHGVSKDPQETLYTVWTCLLAPSALSGPSRLLALVDAAKPAALTSHRYLLWRGMALYRAGKYEDAIRTLDQAVKVHGKGGTVYELLFLAMGHHRLDHKEKAQQMLAQALAWIEAWIEQGRAGTNAEAVNDLRFWHNRLEFQLLQREAEAVVKP